MPQTSSSILSNASTSRSIAVRFIGGIWRIALILTARFKAHRIDVTPVRIFQKPEQRQPFSCSARKDSM